MANKHMKVENKGLGEDIFTKAFHSKPMNIKKEETVLNNSEVLLESFVEEGQSFIEEDVKTDVKNALERLNNDKIMMLEGKIRLLEKDLQRNNEEKLSLKAKLDKAECEKVENDQTIISLESMLKDFTEAEQVDVGEKKVELLRPEVIEKGVQTDETYTKSTTDQETDTEDANFVINADLKLQEKLDEAHKVLLQQENIISTKNGEISLLRSKIRDWGLEEKITEETIPRRRSIGGGTRDDVKKEVVENLSVGSDTNGVVGVKRQRRVSKEANLLRSPKTTRNGGKTPQNKKTDTRMNKTPKRALAESDEDDIVVPDTDLKHPTSSFNLRKKGRNIRGKKPTKLEPMDNMSGPFTEIVESIIVDKGEDANAFAGINRYYVLHKKKDSTRNIDSKPVFRNPGPRVSSWKEHQSKYVR